MEEMKMQTIAQEMSKRTTKIGRPNIKPDHIVKVPHNQCGSSPQYEAYVARADDIIAIAYLWKHGKLTIHTF